MSTDMLRHLTNCHFITVICTLVRINAVPGIYGPVYKMVLGGFLIIFLSIGTWT